VQCDDEGNDESTKFAVTTAGKRHRAAAEVLPFIEFHRPGYWCHHWWCWCSQWCGRIGERRRKGSESWDMRLIDLGKSVPAYNLAWGETSKLELLQHRSVGGNLTQFCAQTC